MNGARSLRARILLGIALPAIAILAAASIVLQLWRSADGLAELDRSLATRAAAMAAMVELEGGVWDVDFDGEELPAAELFGPLVAYDVHVLSSGALLARRGAHDLAGPVPAVPSAAELAALPTDRPIALSGAAGQRDGLRTWTGVYLVRAHDGAADADVGRPAVVAARDEPPVVRIVVAQPLAPLAADRRRMLALQVLIGLAASALALLAGWLLSRRIVDPIEAMAVRAEAVRRPSPEPPLALAGTGDEVDRLADALNRSFGRLHEAYTLQARFTADASHELRTPLAVIRAQAEVALRRPRSTGEYEEALGAVSDGARRMQDTLDALLLLARTDAGASEPGKDVVDLVEIAHDAVAELGDAEGPDVRVEGATSAVVHGDRRQLAIVLANLISNAVRHTPAAGEVVVRATPSPSGVLLEVADTGEGIPAEALPHVFDRFYRVDAGRSRDRGGSGLGLSIVRTVVERHGGAVWAESRLGVGTRVCVRLPAAPGVGNAAPVERAAAPGRA